jgi:hypothetical protein
MRVREPTPVEHLLAGVARELKAERIPCMVIGGQAVLLHGAPRVTEDIDLTLAAGPDRAGDVVNLCGRMGLTPLPADVERFVAETFVLPARHALTGFRVDFIFSTTAYERSAIERARPVDIAGQAVPFATAEDLIVHKLFAARPRDIEDAQGVVRRSGAALDWTYIERWALDFAAVPGREGMPGLVANLRAAR